MAEAARAALAASPVVAVVRAPRIPDAAALCAALAEGGITWAEFTFTTPDVTTHLHRAAQAGHRVGVGTVLTAQQAEQGLAAGASFLVTPGLRPEVAEVAHAAGVPVILGALTATEVAQAVDLGAAAVKIFPARAFGPGYFKDLRGPYPDVPLVASGGVNAGNAADFLAHGALAVCAGTDVVPPEVVAAGDWAEITRRARAFTEACALR
ncbi:bifunctional 4-hydroxy-2-oxoglutarate aldolase/2-dehydro-3-deoxy-phosphogluconate aldolase [Kitasatospora purpeofusca]|uniref:bifunctional 4-hydroxy-2-oxoglutarate aldolase/2-dehydro-3-deoxy-phosphogluconate aldolase n=1 Tax=Kitasatospora purpeofusca TaxID=67352 RepID=UPI002258F3AA|nr:bifunctional 4-hydroxy-2-oxoglutarate aldolase/2-dehydro-3-deoxy-phosphogluconate aldolase [Kitasatospora purpeofusca]MCX4756376.1 bifunctional 4-hydroxy-2-oxoglutarate aldolase/2-dehydro-3-deoxy-phosphogluconate aldolase [Kitasatospora purpeofusca]WSR35798.1 bifunctional 4-hydroxy-2-oxoglutarate aldolase/2-dehydro-3-deoxy-phosphogluconate aldolase [Kitasatospora purpeofusca]WSR44106.1 bifunctional 4-hydroxy-2-oxoglutarate aldolase/2-dehydro-3-deoxy-phosphogluconate aldolase [Kitasatospora pu